MTGRYLQALANKGGGVYLEGYYLPQVEWCSRMMYLVNTSLLPATLQGIPQADQKDIGRIV
jgi:hypothetical protein